MAMFGPTGGMPSDTKKDFARGPQANIKRSVFDRSHGYKTTIDAGYLYPVYFDFVYPSDTFQMKVNMFGRLNTPIFPVMDNIWIECQFFFVPFRLLWTNFQRFMGERDPNPDSSISYLVPQITDSTIASGTLYDYFGLPVGVETSWNNFAGRAYNLVYNEWYRAEWLQDSVVVDKDDGPDDQSDYVLLKRGKRFDYFTSALPSPQAGASVSLPLGTEAPVLGLGKENTTYGATSTTVYESDGTQSTYAASSRISDSDAQDYVQIERNPDNTDYPYVRADLTNATAANINELREAFQLQAFLERSQIGGQRYKEIIYSMFGTLTGDARLDRPEYLGHTKSRIDMNPIPQTSSTDSTTPQGNLSAYATVGYRPKYDTFSKSFTEHGCVIGLASVYSDLNYQQGKAKEWDYRDRFDFYWSAFAHLGEVGIKNSEIYCQGTSADDEIFGYAEKYAELRWKTNQITGLMRSNVAGSLDAWHLAQDFSSLPALNSSFIQENPPIDRVVAVPSQPDLYLDFYFNLRCARPLPLYSTPITLSRF